MVSETSRGVADVRSHSRPDAVLTVLSFVFVSGHGCQFSSLYMYRVWFWLDWVLVYCVNFKSGTYVYGALNDQTQFYIAWNDYFVELCFSRSNRLILLLVQFFMVIQNITYLSAVYAWKNLACMGISPLISIVFYVCR